MIYGVIWTRTELEKGNILCYLADQATQGIKLHVFCTYTRGEDAGVSINQDVHEAADIRVRLKVWVQHDETEGGMFDGL
jgi:hypothetical protein